MSSINKKGVAEIIAVMLITTLAIASVGLVFGIVNNLSADLSPAFDCSIAQASARQIQSACYNTDNKWVEVTIVYPFSSDPTTHYNFGVNSATDNVKFSCGIGGDTYCGDCMVSAQGETTTYYLPLPQSFTGDPTLVSLAVDTCLLDFEESVIPC